MTSRARIATVAAVAGSFAVGLALALVQRQRKAHRDHWTHKDDLRTWEGEGGNVPNVPTPSPQPHVI